MFCSYVCLLQGCIARTEASGGNITLPGHDSPMHEIENAAELGSDEGPLLGPAMHSHCSGRVFACTDTFINAGSSFQ